MRALPDNCTHVNFLVTQHHNNRVHAVQKRLADLAARSRDGQASASGSSTIPSSVLSKLGGGAGERGDGGGPEEAAKMAQQEEWVLWLCLDVI